MTQLEIINKEISVELAKEEVRRALLATTFKGLNELSMRQALMEGMIRGFAFQDFLEKKVYAIPFKDGYSLVTSIDYSRSIGMRSGVVGKDAPIFETDPNGKVVSCTVTIKRKIDEYVGDFTATVFFDEYYKAGRNGYPSLWDQKPRTMIAKVAEMHALRMACPEELDKAYVEEELTGGAIDLIDTDTQAEINNLKDQNELKDYYQANKGKGKAFDKAIAARKAELEADHASGSDTAESRVVPDEVA